MLEERSLDIALSEIPAEAGSVEVTIVPLCSTESLVAYRGLYQHIGVLYNAVREKSSNGRALLSVHEFIGDNIDEFRTRAANITSAINTERYHAEPRAFGALAMTYLVVGQRFHRTGVWLKGEAKEKKLKETFIDIMAKDDLDYLELLEWAKTQSYWNERFWRQELQAVRSHPVIAELREAIETSDHASEV